ncbi:MAG: hypothetical protein OEZ34_06165 [Spirochaetia bacterium]|nr:hypothetical protein [Spirochaetia bacterium]
MQYSIPRPVFNKLEKSLGDKQTAEELASSMENAVNEISMAVDRQTIEKMNLVKSEIKDDLTKTLVTRELFEEKFNSMETYVNQRFIAMENKMDQRFLLVDEKLLHLEEKMEERFKRTDFKFHVLIGISVIGFTLINPEFINLIKLILK